MALDPHPEDRAAEREQDEEQGDPVVLAALHQLDHPQDAELDRAGRLDDPKGAADDQDEGDDPDAAPDICCPRRDPPKAKFNPADVRTRRRGESASPGRRPRRPRPRRADAEPFGPAVRVRSMREVLEREFPFRALGPSESLPEVRPAGMA